MKKVILLLSALCLTLCLTLCLPCAAEKANAQVVASFYPVYILAQNVLRDVPGVTVSCMTAPTTGCLHDYQLLASDMRALSAASALIINGAGMESFLDKIAAQFPDLQLIDSSQGVSLLAEDHDEDEAHAHDHNGREHTHGEYNAHIWLDPQNAVRMAENMCDGLSALFPDHAAQIAQNTADYTAQLRALDQTLRDGLSTLPRRQIVTFHEAFSYFANAYGLKIAAVVALEPEEPLSPQMVSRVITVIRGAGCPPLFAEPQYGAAALQVISRETGAPLYALDPLVTGDGAMDAYQRVMLDNLAVLQRALGNESKE